MEVTRPGLASELLSGRDRTEVHIPPFSSTPWEALAERQSQAEQLTCGGGARRVSLTPCSGRAEPWPTGNLLVLAWLAHLGSQPLALTRHLISLGTQGTVLLVTCWCLQDLDGVSVDGGGHAGSVGRPVDFFQRAVTSPLIEVSLSLQVERDFEREYGKLQQ